MAHWPLETFKQDSGVGGQWSEDGDRRSGARESGLSSLWITAESSLAVNLFPDPRILTPIPSQLNDFNGLNDLNVWNDVNQRSAGCDD
jgi:hypothetical protein